MSGSVLESLYILVKLETDQLKKGLADTQAQVKNLEKEFDNLGKAGDKVTHSFDSVLKSALKVFAGFASFNAILSGASGAVASIREVGQAARELNVDVSTLDAWGSAVERLGGSASGFQSSLDSLAQHFGTTNDIALKALPKLADTFSRLNSVQARNYGKSLGLDQSTILFLQQGRREVEATITQQRQLGTVTKEQVEVTNKFDNALHSLSRVFQNIQREAALPALPYLTEAFKYLVEHKDLIEGALIAIGVGVAAMGVSFAAANPAIAALAASLVAFTLAYEDFKAFQKGDLSFLGLVVQDYHNQEAKVGSFVERIAPSFLDDQHLNDFASKYFHLPQFLGGEGYGGSKGTQATVNIGDVTINTAATDGQGVAKAFVDTLGISQLISQVDNGVQK